MFLGFGVGGAYSGCGERWGCACVCVDMFCFCLDAINIEIG